MSFLKSIWRGPSKHKKLAEDFVLSKQEESNTNLEGVSFDVKYLGSTLVETPNGEGSTAEAIKTVITMAKASSKKLQRVSLTVGLNGIRMVDIATDEIHLDVSIYRISYCSADATYDHVFAFIATNSNETMECHAFLCPKRKVAQAVTMTIAQSFTMAYELWQISQAKHDLLPEKTDNSSSDTQNEDDPIKEKARSDGIPKSRSHSLLIDLSSEVPSCTEPTNWVCFEDDEFENLNSSFARLAASRSSTSTTPISRPLNPPPRSISLDPTTASSHSTKNPWNEQHNSIDLFCS
ncbi:low density lipoprotein receptor adapter protein 1-B-like [Neocloeon triangulifer]|uniref:low density lipoprotein receptor adapter protein 1-B-like n=1 Tax=Neocloeon triangulifer TaxID=2078957 RepID=UPI00286F1675|nr:low density lipoprotein receptor adapter protein 1-B-like [Neocloeon triangulifer]